MLHLPVPRLGLPRWLTAEQWSPARLPSMRRPRASHSPQMQGPRLLQASPVRLLLQRMLRQAAKRQQMALPRSQK